ncbi:hypothetical protein [Sinimarinibacterium thermocellulolyticum]|uniref:Lipoprotein n=1 Tax=Sinimarinibacterium thermocellulolyticum TaxID=3170016 RepID=A0ABV2A9R2_9GAMM
MLSACGGSGSSDAVAADALPIDVAADDALKPNERLQGTIELDIGKGATVYRSIATKLADNLGEVAAQQLDSAEGRRTLDDANARLKGDVKVQSSDVQALADHFAGKTIYTSELRDIDMIKRRNVTIRGISAGGATAALVLSFTMADNRLESAVLEYTPDNRKLTQSFTTDEAHPAEVSIERFEQIEDSTWRIAGSFKADKMVPNVLAKKLAGQTVDGASGRFDITELRAKPKL